MALSRATLGSISSTTNTATYNTTTHGSGTIAAGAAGRAIFAIVSAVEASGTPPTPTLINHSAMPFELLVPTVGSNPTTSGTSLVGVWGCLATSTTADDVDVDFGGNGQGGCLVSFVEVSGFDVAPASIHTAFRQFEVEAIASGLSATVTLDSFSDADNMLLAGIGALAIPVAEAISEEGSSTALHELGHGSPNRSLDTYAKDNDNTASWSWPTTNSTSIAVAMEIDSTGGPQPGFTELLDEVAVFHSGGSGSGDYTSSSFSTSAGKLLVAAICYDNQGSDVSGSIPTPTTSGLTWVKKGSIYNTGRSNSCHAEIWEADSGSGGSITIAQSGSGAWDTDVHSVHLWVGEFDGFATVANQPGATASAASTSGSARDPGAQSITLSAAPDATSTVIGIAAGDCDNAATISPGAGWVETSDSPASVGAAFMASQVQWRAASTSTSVAWSDLNTAGAGTYDYCLLAVEVVQAAGGLEDHVSTTIDITTSLPTDQADREDTGLATTGSLTTSLPTNQADLEETGHATTVNVTTSLVAQQADLEETGLTTTASITTSSADQADLEETGLPTTLTITTSIVTDQADLEETGLATTINVTTSVTDVLNGGGVQYEDNVSTDIAVTTTAADQQDMEEAVSTTASITTALTVVAGFIEAVSTTAAITTTIPADQQDHKELALATNISVITSVTDIMPEPDVEGVIRIERGVEERLMYSDSAISQIRLRVRIES